jgi:hypothetical protein
VVGYLFTLPLFGLGSSGTEVNKDKDNGLAKEIRSREYKNQTPAAISPLRMKTAAGFVADVEKLAQKREIGVSFPHISAPTPREAARFLAMSEATGDPSLALEAFKVYCDPSEDLEEQWGLIKQAFARYYRIHINISTPMPPLFVNPLNIPLRVRLAQMIIDLASGDIKADDWQLVTSLVPRDEVAQMLLMTEQGMRLEQIGAGVPLREYFCRIQGLMK